MNIKPTLLALTIVCNTAQGAATFTYSQSGSPAGTIGLGYPVPIPVDSLTPIDGFRTYQSLSARHQQLVNDADFVTGEVVGQTIKGEDIWLYTVSDNDDKTHSGAQEGATLINGGIHAREWQSPEAVTGFMEQLYNNRNNQYIESYLVDNLKMMFIPVLNIDGFKQTQRYPDKVTNSVSAPREGRMRRKNLRGVDFDINTGSDNLLGIDLNRNSEPFWATTTSSSSDPSSLVYHGSAPASEPEIDALINAAQIAPADRLRLFLDVHSFTQIYFTPMTGNSRRDAITGNVMSTMRAVNDFKYAYGPGTPGRGIGTTAGYFAVIHQIPSATLETEPTSNGAADYGGNGVSHDGFILPESQVRRMVNETTQATLSGFYAQAEKPILNQVMIRNKSTNEIVVDGSWLSSVNGRQRVFDNNNALGNDTQYQVSLIFNKPMRWLIDGEAATYPSINMPLLPTVGWFGADSAGNAIEANIDVSTGNWLVDSGFSRYKTDTFVFDMTLPDTLDWSQLVRIAFSVSTSDMVNQRLDTNPASVVDWQNGSWSHYENTNGEALDSGGIDKSFRLVDDGSDLYAQQPTPTPTPVPVPPTTPTTNNSSSGGGGSFSWVGLLGLLILWRKSKTAQT
jgi:hypothetical protein